MPSVKKTKTCPNGHNFVKSSDCPVCPKCEAMNKPFDGFLASLGAPARRALENEGITSIEQLYTYSEKEILSLHGMGKITLLKLRIILEDNKLNFRS